MYPLCHLSIGSLRCLPAKFLLCGVLAAFVEVDAAATVLAIEESAAATSEVSDEQAEFFRGKVLPLLESRCFECHGDQDDIEAELSLASRKSMLKGGETGPAIVPSDADRSLLIQAIRYEGLQMPPRSKMPEEEIEILVNWINDGAPWPVEMERAEARRERAQFPLEERIASHWAWKKIQRPVVPEVRQGDWPANDIDRFLLAKLEDAEIAPAPDADRRSILRRLYLDLTGLPPTIEQQDQFFHDPAETSEAMEKVVDALLASSQFGERWARHWLDLMRYAETLGHEFDYPLPYAWRYRDYVIRALNADVPYDQFVREHLAGDLLAGPRRHPELGFNESIIATGFWYLCEDKHAPVDVKAEEALRIDNQIDVFGKTFLGLTIACARCHDHKFDAITAEDYYALSGFLQSSRRRVEWLDSHDETSRLLLQILKQQAAASVALNQGLQALRPNSLASLLREAMLDSQSVNAGEFSDGQVAAIKQMLTDPKSKELSNPLSLFATLIQAPADAGDSAVIKDWLSFRRNAVLQPDFSAADVSETDLTKSEMPETEIFAKLKSGFLPEGWFAYGYGMFHELSKQQRQPYVGAFTRDQQQRPQWDHVAAEFESHPVTRARQLNWSPAGIVVDEQDFITSAKLSPELKGVLHSEEFELRHPEVQILAAGRNARVRLVIDGYVMNEFSELLFSGCRQPIDTNGEFRWIRLAGDVRRYIGHRCHLEFLDDGDGWFAVREVRFMAHSDEMLAPSTPICLTNETMVVSPELSRERLIEQAVSFVSSDPGWASVALKAGLLPTEQQRLFSEASQAWMQLAAIPQFSGTPVLVMCDGSGEDEYVFIRGNHNNRGPIATRHLLTALDGGRALHDERSSGRLELADRVLSESNPFPSRVMVNRVWQHLFGRGIVATSDNFGVLGEAPTHPELLDYLATEFRDDGWSLKRLIKRLVLTRAYRLSSQRTEISEQKDPSNKLLHRFSIRRLEAEAIRDAVLSVSGRLDTTMYGPSVPVFLTEFMQGRGRPGQSGPLDGAGRRSIYQSVNRNFLNPFMLAFDTPQPATTIGRRTVSNVPAQALILLNNEFIHQQAKVWAERLLKNAAVSGTERLEFAFRQSLCRVPSSDELISISDFAADLAMAQNRPSESALDDLTILTEVCHILLNQKEFVYLD